MITAQAGFEFFFADSNEKLQMNIEAPSKKHHKLKFSGGKPHILRNGWLYLC